MSPKNYWQYVKPYVDMRLALKYENFIFEITSPMNTGPYLRIADEISLSTKQEFIFQIP